MRIRIFYLKIRNSDFSMLITTWNWGHYTSGYRHRSNGRSQTHGLLMRNDQYTIAHLLSLLSTILVKVDFFQILTFGSTLECRQRSNCNGDLAEIWHMSTRDPREHFCQFLWKSNGKAFHCILYCSGFFQNYMIHFLLHKNTIGTKLKY